MGIGPLAGVFAHDAEHKAGADLEQDEQQGSATVPPRLGPQHPQGLRTQHPVSQDAERLLQLAHRAAWAVMHGTVEQGDGNQRADAIDPITTGWQPVVRSVKQLGVGRGRIADGNIRLAIPIEVDHAVFLAVGSIGHAELGVAAPVGRVVDLTPFHIGTEQPGKRYGIGIRQHKRPLDLLRYRSVPRGLMGRGLWWVTSMLESEILN